MANIVTALTHVAPTGAGLTYVPWNLQGPLAIYHNEVSGQLPRTLTMKRTDAVKTKGYDGALRTMLKTQQGHVHAVTGVTWPKVGTTTFSLPSFLTLAEKLAFVDEHFLAARQSVINEFFASGVVPQS